MHGNFSTRGKYLSAMVRGIEKDVADPHVCAGHPYLAEAPG